VPKLNKKSPTVVPGDLRWKKKHVLTVVWTMGHYHAYRYTVSS